MQTETNIKISIVQKLYSKLFQLMFFKAQVQNNKNVLNSQSCY